MQSILETCTPRPDILTGTFNPEIFTANLSQVIEHYRGRATTVHNLYTCHLNLRDARIVNELIGRTGSGDLLVALNADVGGVDTGGLAEGMSRAQEADRKNPHPEGYPLHEYAWKTVFLHSLVGRGEGLASNRFGITERDALFEVSFPGLTPPQVQTTLQEIQNTALYLRFSQDHGRYYVSLDASINRALDGIRRSLPRQQVSDFLAASARKVITSDPVFKVFHEVSLPEHINDNTQRPCLGLIALDADEIVSYTGTPAQHEKPSELVHGAAAILHSASTQDVLVTPAEAARRGWLAVEQKRYQLSGREAAQKFLPLLKRVGNLYSRGAKSTLDILDLVELPVGGGARLRITLQGATPETMQRLGEWFEILGDLVQPGGTTEGRIQITDPDDHCAFLRALKEGG